MVDEPDDQECARIELNAAMSERFSEMLASDLYADDEDVTALLQAQARGDYELANRLGKALHERLEREGQ
jgi:hypothetical protein